MKKIILLLVLATTTCFSQSEIKVELGDFHEIKVFNGLYVDLIKADSPRIEISGIKSEELVYKNVNGRLKLSMRFPKTFNAADVITTVYYSGDLTLIDANEGSKVSSDKTFKQQSIELKTQEGGIIDVIIDVKYATIKTVSGGNIYAKGFAANQDVEANTGGVYKGYNVKTDATTVSSSSGALVRVSATDLLDCKVRFGGTVYYKGTPTEVKTEKIIGGTIKSKD